MHSDALFVFFHPLGDRASPPGLTVRHAALAPLRVPSGPPLALRHPDRVGHGVPGDQEVHPQGPGREKCAAGLQGGGEDRGLRPDEGPEPGDGSLRHVGTQAHPVRMVRVVGRSKFGGGGGGGINTSPFSPVICMLPASLQVCSRESSRRLLLPLLRRVDVWRHPVGDVHVLRGALVRSVRPTGTHLSAAPALFVAVHSQCTRLGMCVPTLAPFVWLVTQSCSIPHIHSLRCRSCGAWNGRASVWRDRRIVRKSCTPS